MFRVTRTSIGFTEPDSMSPDDEWAVAPTLIASLVDPTALDPVEVRMIILAEHNKLRTLLARLESGATTLLASSVPNAKERRAVRRLALHLCSEMAAHIGFENQVLVPVVACVDAWGPERAKRMLDEHAEQLELLRVYTEMLTRSTERNQGLALTVWQLVQTIREDMEDEEATVLNWERLSDPCLRGGDVETG